MFEKIIDKLNKAAKVGIFTHINPDGDALGSSYSLKAVLWDLGKECMVYTSDDIESKLLKVIEFGDESNLSIDDCDLLIALDSADLKRLGKWSEIFKCHPNTIAIDHHITHIEYAKETVVCDVSSTCEVMWKLYKEMGISISEKVATNLYIGLSTDTGNFKYSSVTGESHRMAAELIEAGVKFSHISKVLFDTVSKEYLALKSYGVNKLEFYGNDRIALLFLSDDDFKKCNVSEADASSIVTLPSSIEGVEVGVYVRQRSEREIKVSLRSVSYVDVSAIAISFLGGGHIRAAGYSVDIEDYEDNKKKLIAKIEEQLV